MNVSTQIHLERSSLLSVAEALQVMVGFGDFYPYPTNICKRLNSASR